MFEIKKGLKAEGLKAKGFFRNLRMEKKNAIT